MWLSRFTLSLLRPETNRPMSRALAKACADRFDPVALGRGIHLTVSLKGEGHPSINTPPEWIDKLAAVVVDDACRYADHDGAALVFLQKKD